MSIGYRKNVADFIAKHITKRTWGTFYYIKCGEANCILNYKGDRK